MHLEHPKVLTDTLHIITVVAVPIHIFGTYCILSKTPKAMGSGKWIMLNFHFWCMLLDYGITVLAVPFMLFPALAGIPYGILRDLGAPVEFDAYFILALLAVVCVFFFAVSVKTLRAAKKIRRQLDCFVVCALSRTIVSVVSAAVITIFENRYFIVFAENTKWRYWRYPLSASNYFICSTWCLPAFLFVPDQKMAIKASLDMLGDNIPDYIRNGEIYVLSLDLKTITLPCFLAIMYIVPQAFIFITLMKKGLGKLKKTARFSESTLRMQRNFLRAVYIQVSVYMTSIQVPAAYVFISVLFKIYNQAANNMVFVIFSFNGVSSTIVMIWIHKPYRDYCFKLLRIGEFSRAAQTRVNSQGTTLSVAPNVI